MSAADIRDRLREAEDQGRPWALLIEHVDGRVEAHTWQGVSFVVTVVDQARSALGAWVLVDELVPCDVGVVAVGYSLGECERCHRDRSRWRDGDNPLALIRESARPA